MNDLRVTLVQTEQYWQDPEKNREQFARKLENPPKTDVILLPEMFPTGFTMEAEKCAESTNGSSVSWMKNWSHKHGIALTGSIITEEGGNYFNRMYWCPPDGKVEFYNKRHLFRMADEHHHYTPGRERKVVNYRGWRILLQVCYDLRFPVWSRSRNDYDAIFYVANWPTPRINAWDTLLRARAIENLCYVCGVNRVGSDGLDIPYDGHSVVIDPKGHTILEGPVREEWIKTTVLSKEELDRFRQKFPAYRDADEFILPQEEA